MKKSVIAFLAFFLSSCATGHLYKEPTANQPKATLTTIKHQGIFRVPKVVINEINGKPIDIVWKGGGANRYIKPGLTHLHVSAVLPGSRLTANAILSFKALPNRTYILNQNNSIKSVRFSVIDKATNRVIKTATSRKVVEPPSPEPLFIPIFI